ncbi:lipid asymmetry maintenance protein MlaB [Hydrogenophaga sp.]|uniref:STAS domain-containing protein n=1 Tax=Hydrogenophaga sp. TaxID=1904254 RepID=UPI00271645BF|nr:STAS domain-containing protein [Hydrogenophaga sp.]MDO8903260.1 STAS domain-containing protein [Hydrogenophaga sp.]
MSNPAIIAMPDVVTMHVASGVLQALSSSLALQTDAVATVDAHALQTFDSSAVAVLLELKRELAQGGRTLEVVNLPPKLKALVALYGVSEMLPA